MSAVVWKVSEVWLSESLGHAAGRELGRGTRAEMEQLMVDWSVAHGDGEFRLSDVVWRLDGGGECSWQVIDCADRGACWVDLLEVIA